MAAILAMVTDKRGRGRPVDPTLQTLKLRAFFLRTLRGLTVREIADSFGRSPRQIYAWIREAAQLPECQGISRQSKAG